MAGAGHGLLANTVLDTFHFVGRILHYRRTLAAFECGCARCKTGSGGVPCTLRFLMLYSWRLFSLCALLFFTMPH